MNHKRRFTFEALEPRICLAWTTSVDGTTLTFDGTAGQDTLSSIRAVAGEIRYDDETGAGKLAAGNPTTVNVIIIKGQGEDDRIWVDDGAVGFTLNVRFDIQGGDGDDDVDGPPGIPGHFHIIRGQGDIDDLRGGDGPDRIFGGDEADAIWGNAGNDVIYGGNGDDTMLVGGGGIDYVYGDAGADHVLGGADNDFVFGGPEELVYDDHLEGNGGDDHIYSNSDVAANQPYWPTAGRIHVHGTGGAGCDIEDGEDECWVAAIDDTYGALAGAATRVTGNTDTGQPGYGVVANDDCNIDGDCGCLFEIGEFTLTVVYESGGRFVPETNPQGHHTGGFTYTADYRIGGPYTVTYGLYNCLGSYDEGTITFNIANPPPTGQPDYYNALGQGSLIVEPNGVLANDSDPNGDGLQVQVVQNPQYGIVAGFDYGDGGFTYTGTAPDHPGTDTFTYQIMDGFNTVGPITVTITNIVVEHSQSLLLDQPALQNSTAAAITADQARRFLIAAGERWQAAGASGQTVSDAIAGATVVIANLPGTQLATVIGSVIYVDANAAGYGWFVDATAGEDSEFGRIVSPSEMRAGTSSAAYGRADLLTTMEHELGHLLGAGHSEVSTSIMYDTLGLGVRRVPTAHDAAMLFFTSDQDGQQQRA